MSDNLRRYRAIRDALTQCYPGEPTGHRARHLTTLAALISGIVASKSTHLPHIATKIPDSSKAESRVKRFARWLQNANVQQDVYFLPYAAVLLAHLALETLILAIDGSAVGRGCVALMIHVVYKGRALPLCWQVRQGKKGHFPQQMHIALVEQLHAFIPPEAQVVFLGDGEFDGTDLQHTLAQAGWFYVCRTAKSTTVTWQGQTFRLEFVSSCMQPGTLVDLSDVLFTADKYGPIRLICCWQKGCQEPVYLVTNMVAAEMACRLYAKRFRIETFFSDQKSRGFHLHKSHLRDPDRLSRLLIAACLAYIWIVYLGSLGSKEAWVGTLHRRHRCDLSLFQVGLRLLDHALNEGLSLPVAFHVTTE